MIYNSMDKNIHLYYSLNTDKQTVRKYKSGEQSISIVKVPEHISLKLTYNLLDIDGHKFTASAKYLIFRKFNEDEFKFIYEMLYPEPNLIKALCNIEHDNDAVRYMSIAIVKGKYKKCKFDYWFNQNNGNGDKIRYLNIEPIKFPF